MRLKPKELTKLSFLCDAIAASPRLSRSLIEESNLPGDLKKELIEVTKDAKNLSDLVYSLSTFTFVTNNPNINNTFFSLYKDHIVRSLGWSIEHMIRNKK